MTAERIKIEPASANKAGKASAYLSVPDTILGIGSVCRLTVTINNTAGLPINRLSFEETTPIVISVWDFLQYINFKYDRLWQNTVTAKAELLDKDYRFDVKARVDGETVIIDSFEFDGIYNNWQAPGFYINGDSLTDAPDDGDEPVTSWAYLLRDRGFIHPDSIINAAEQRSLFNTGYPIDAAPSENVQNHMLFLSSNDALYIALGGALTESEHKANVQSYMDEAIADGFTNAYKILPPNNNSPGWNDVITEMRGWEVEQLGPNIPWNIITSDYIDNVHPDQVGQEKMAAQMLDYIIARVPKVTKSIVDTPNDELVQIYILSAINLPYWEYQDFPELVDIRVISDNTTQRVTSTGALRVIPGMAA